MASYLNVHAVLEERRKAARAAGPAVRTLRIRTLRALARMR
jgi:hypothetical protein